VTLFLSTTSEGDEGERKRICKNETQKEARKKRKKVE
jgi:hypothetical protein